MLQNNVYDFCCVQETHTALARSDGDQYLDTGFRVFEQSRLVGEKGGLALLVADGWQHLHVTKSPYCIAALVQKQQVQCVIATIYIPPSSSKHMQGTFENAIECIVEQVQALLLMPECKPNTPAMLAGDFNARIGRQASHCMQVVEGVDRSVEDHNVNSRGTTLMRIMNQYGLQLWNGYFGSGGYTRYDSINSNSEIDFVFSLNLEPSEQQECVFNIDDQVVELGFSDHAMLNFSVRNDKLGQ